MKKKKRSWHIRDTPRYNEWSLKDDLPSLRVQTRYPPRLNIFLLKDAESGAYLFFDRVREAPLRWKDWNIFYLRGRLVGILSRKNNEIDNIKNYPEVKADLEY